MKATVAKLVCDARWVQTGALWALFGLAIPLAAQTPAAHLSAQLERIPLLAWYQEEQAAPQEKEKQESSEANSGESADENSPMVETEVNTMDQPGDREIRLTLWDGSVVTGDLGVQSIHIDTKFGTLEVPVSNILYLRPGLDSNPSLNQELATLVEQLGDKEFQVRERAHRQLLGMGLALRSQLRNFSDGGSAERKKHLQTLTEEIEQLAEDEDLNAGSEEPLEREDSITTGQFTIVGKVRESKFAMATRYGQLDIELKDIRRGDRTWGSVASTIRKSLDVDAAAFFQRKPCGTRIRLKPGDRVSIRASGNVHWTNWGNIVSTPDGIPNQGQWNGINCGALVAMVGKSGEPITIGEKGEFVAKTAGELILGVAMQDNYANQEGYTWTGKYTARIVVEPDSK